MASDHLEIAIADPRTREALELFRLMAFELSTRYDFLYDGTFGFKPEHLTGPGSAFAMGSVNNVPVACGGFRPFAEGIVEIKRMFVISPFRGRGYSKAILAELERLAREQGYTTARLETGDRQPEAIGLYESTGYFRIEPGPDSIWYEKPL